MKTRIGMLALISLLLAAPIALAQEPAPVAAPVAAETVPAPAVEAPAPVSAPEAASAVEAPEEASVAWWEVLLQHLMELIFAVVGIMATGFITVMMRKYGFESQSAKINELLMKAVNYAEQKALAASKVTEGEKTPSAEKMNMAIKFAQEMAKEYKVKDKGTEYWEKMLESKLLDKQA